MDIVVWVGLGITSHWTQRQGLVTDNITLVIETGSVRDNISMDIETGSD